MGFLTPIIGWFLGGALKRVGGDILQKAFDLLGKTSDGVARLKEIESSAKVALAKEDTKRLEIYAAAANARQMVKMNWPVFWILIIVMMANPAITLGAITAYNIFWWEHGIWPQAWAIAAYPPSVAPWVQASIDWLYDPLGAPTGVGSALIAGYVTGGRR